LYKKSIVIERAGRKIGLVGALLAATVNMTNTENLHILDEIESVKKESERLKNEKGVDIIIVLSHCGLVIDRRMALQSGSAIDVIVGGHSHTFLYSGFPLPSTNVPADKYPIVYEQPGGHKVLIVQAFAYTKYLGDLTVYFDSAGEIRNWEGNPIFLENSIVPDPEIVEAMKPWKAVVDAVAKREIGIVKTTLNQRDCNAKECNIGNFITDAFVDYFVDHPDYKEDDGSWTYGTIAITNHGGIRTGWHQVPSSLTRSS
jgi:5'-nucleotidase